MNQPLPAPTSATTDASATPRASRICWGRCHSSRSGASSSPRSCGGKRRPCWLFAGGGVCAKASDATATKYGHHGNRCHDAVHPGIIIPGWPPPSSTRWSRSSSGPPPTCRPTCARRCGWRWTAKRSRGPAQALSIIGQNIDQAAEVEGAICQDTGMPTFEVKTPVGFNQIALQDSHPRRRRRGHRGAASCGPTRSTRSPARTPATTSVRARRSSTSSSGSTTRSRSSSSSRAAAART